MPRLIEPFKQFFDDSGNPLISGTLTFYEPGTTTAKTTYSDLDETTPNSNPVSLTSAGRCPDVFGSGSYKIVSKNSGGVTIETFDPVGGTSGSSPYEDWNSLTTYSIGDLVVGSNGYFYESLTNSNQGNDPISDDVNWQQFEFVYFYNDNREYSEDDRVRDSDGLTYISLADSNTGNTPSTSPLYWAKASGTTTVTITSSPSAANMALYKKHNFPVFNNIGAGALEFPMPAAIVGLSFGFMVTDNAYVRATANGTDVFEYANESSAAGGYIRTNVVGTFFVVECFKTGIWTITQITNDVQYDR